MGISLKLGGVLGLSMNARFLITEYGVIQSISIVSVGYCFGDESNRAIRGKGSQRWFATVTLLHLRNSSPEKMPHLLRRRKMPRRLSLFLNLRRVCLNRPQLVNTNRYSGRSDR